MNKLLTKAQALGKQLAEKKTKLARFEGQQEELRRALKEHGVSSIEEAKALIESKQAEAQELVEAEQQLSDRLDSIEALHEDTT